MGISGPIKPRHTALRRSAPTRAPGQVIEAVVNVAFGIEIGNGRRLRKFHVRLMNQITNQSRYTWVDEDAVTTADAEMLAVLFKRHVESKMTVIQGL
jgi:hypothetical protein